MRFRSVSTAGRVCAKEKRTCSYTGLEILAYMALNQEHDMNKTCYLGTTLEPPYRELVTQMRPEGLPNAHIGFDLW